jgi:hypothetical protein
MVEWRDELPLYCGWPVRGRSSLPAVVSVISMGCGSSSGAMAHIGMLNG